MSQESRPALPNATLIARNPEDLFRVIDDALTKLAAEGSPEQVAARLLAEQCSGYRKISEDCPIVQWIAATTGHRVKVYASTWCERSEHPDRVLGFIPEVLQEFVKEFDAGWFPDLDIPGGAPA